MATPPELQQLLAQSRDRTAYQNPLFQAVTQMAYNGLPTYARQGTQLSGTLSNQAPPVAPQGGGGSDLAKMLAAGGAGALAGNALSGGNALGALIAGLKKLFGHGGRDTVQGDQPYGGGALTGPGFDPNGFMGWDASVSDPQGNPYLPSDPGFYVGGGMPMDPSGGSGVGPGMQAFRGGGGETMTNWWEE